MPTQAIPTFDQFKAQQGAAIPTFEQFKAGIPPNPSDSIPAAKPPVPTELQGPAPSRLSRAVTNLPYSVVNSLENTVKGPQMGGDDAFHAPTDGMSSFQRIGKFLEHPIDNTLDWAADDPVSAAQQVVLAGKGGVEAYPAVRDAVVETAPKVAAVVKGAAKGAKEGALSTSEVPGHSYAARVAKALGVEKVPAVATSAVLGKYSAHLLLGPDAAIAGEVVGAAAPIVRGAWRGAKQGLKDYNLANAEQGAPISNQSPSQPATVAPSVQLPSPATLEKLNLTPEQFLAFPKDGQAEIMAMDHAFRNPPAKRPPPALSDLAAPPSVEEPSAPVKSQEELLQEVIAQKKAERLEREAAARPAPVQAASANPDPAIGKDFGDHARLQPRADLPELPGHTRLNSDMGQSIAYDPATREMQILFKRDGTLYRYPNVPPEEHQALMNAPSMGAHFQRSFRPKFKGIKMLMPGPVDPLLPGIPPAVDAAPLPPPPASGTLPSDEAARIQGQGLPSPADDRGGAPSQRPPDAPANGALQAGASNTTLLIPGSAEAYPARYELRELSDINASHNGNTFQPNPKYTFKNERDYTKRDNQAKVVTNSGPLFEPRFHINDNPDSTNGPPIIDPYGNAIGGNGRKMMLDRVYATNPRGAQAYRELLTKKADQFGIDPAQVAQMKQPVLVRVLGEEDSARAIADLNRTGTAALTPSERAIADSRRVSRGTLDDIAARMDALGTDATLAKALEGRSGAEVLNRLIDDGVISPQERAALAQGDDLTEAGRTRISKLMLGRFFRDPAQMDSISPVINRKLERIAGPVAAAEEVPGWGVGEHLKNALDLIESAKAAGRKNLDDFVKQSGLYSSEQFPPAIVDLAKSLQKTTQGQALIAARNYLEKARYAHGYQGPGMFNNFPEPSNPQAALADFLQDIKKPVAPKPQVDQGNSSPGNPGSPEVPPNPFR